MGPSSTIYCRRLCSVPPSFSHPRRDLGTPFPSRFNATCKWLPAEFTRQCSQRKGVCPHRSTEAQLSYLSSVPLSWAIPVSELPVESGGVSITKAAQLPSLPGLGSFTPCSVVSESIPNGCCYQEHKNLDLRNCFSKEPYYGNDDHSKDKKTQIHKRRQKSSIILSPIC